jgi:hypothetical protein
VFDATISIRLTAAEEFVTMREPVLGLGVTNVPSDVG